MSDRSSKWKKVGWKPFENSERQFNDFMTQAGFRTSKYCFIHITALDELDDVPRPALAVVLVYPVKMTMDTSNTGETSRDATSSTSTVDEIDESKNDGKLWFLQSVNKAICGLESIVHSVMNLSSHRRNFLLNQDSWFGLFREICPPNMPSLEKSEHLEKDYFAKTTNNRVTAPDAMPFPPDHFVPNYLNEDYYNHFISFVEVGGEVIELDSHKHSPISHGPKSGDFLSHVCRIVRDELIKNVPDDLKLDFGVLALVPNIDNNTEVTSKRARDE